MPRVARFAAWIGAALLLVVGGTASAQTTFQHRIDVKLPKGTNGVQPDIAMGYSSSAGNGLFGVGWQLLGVPAIVRVNYGQGIRYSGNDTYAHTQLGVLVKQTDGSYRTKRESFSKFVPSTVLCGDGPCSWTVTDRTGIRSVFGVTEPCRTPGSYPNACLHKAGTTNVRAWGLSSVTDLFGNYYDVVYDGGIAANGKLAVSVLTYTKGPGLSATRTVTFSYVSRADVERGYPQGSLEVGNSLVSAITVRSDGTLLREYRFGYGSSDATSRSVLTSVGEYGSDGSVLLTRRFGYQRGNETPGAAADLLSTIDNGIGGSVTVAYAPAPQVANAVQPLSAAPGVAFSAPLQLVTRVTTSDGRGGYLSTRYAYSDARVVTGTIPNQRFLGFGTIDTIDEQTGQYVRTVYRQDPPFEGAVSQVQQYARNGQLMRQTTHAYDSVAPSAGTELIRDTSTTTTAYEFGVAGFSQVETRTYDDYGNVTVRSLDANGLPNVTITTNYTNNPVSWVLGRVDEVLTKSGTTVFGDMKNTWNNNTITAKSEWFDVTNTWVVTSMTYDANGNLSTVTEPAAVDGLLRRTTTDYDTKYHAYPVKVTNALGQYTQRSHNEDGLVVSVTDANQQTTTFGYDVYGRKTSETRPDGGTTTYSYVNYGDASRQYDETLISVDANRVLFRREYFDGAGFKYLVQSNSDCGTARVTVGSRTYQYMAAETQKDYAGRPYRSSQPYCGGGSAVWATTTYDDAGRPSYIETVDAKSIQYRYGTDYRSETDQNVNETRTYYDARGRVASVRDPALRVTSYTYDALGRLAGVLLPDNAQSYAFAYDSLNRRTRATAPAGAASVTTTYEYDAVGNVKIVTAGGRTVTLTYDALNRVVKKEPSAEMATSYNYDESTMAYGAGRLTSVVTATESSSYSYERTGLPHGMTRVMASGQFTQTMTYDQAGRVIGLTYPDGSLAQYAYTDGGNLSSLTLGGASIATWTGHDASGAPGTVTYGNGVTTAYGYDAMGHLTSLATTKGTTEYQKLQYDWYAMPNTGGLAIGNVTDNRINKMVPDYTGNLVNTDETQAYSYDAAGRLQQASGMWGGVSSTKSFAYDAVGNPTTFGGLVNRTVQFTGMQIASGTGLSNYRYDPAGNLIHKVQDGVTWDYAWTAEGRLASATKNGAPSPTAEMTYAADGLRMLKVFRPATGPVVTTAYFGQLYEKRTFSDGSPEQHTLNLFAYGQLVASVTKTGNILTASTSSNGERAQWALASLYDARTGAGIARKVIHSAAALGARPGFVRSIALTIFALIAGVIALVLLRALSTRAFTVRIPGRLRVASLGTLLVFGFAACSGSGGGTAVSRDAILSGDTTGGVPAGTLFYHRNQVTSSTVITDSAGAEKTRIVYLPFGELSQANSAGTDLATSKFTGKEFDEETGLYYYGARYYDPAVGRFASADSIVPDATDAEAFNRYGYARNNPVVYVDPSGHAFEFIAKAAARTADAVASVAVAVGRFVVGHDVAGFIDRAGGYSRLIVKQMLHDPYAGVSLLVAVAACIATLGEPAPLIAWAISIAAAVSAESLALAAGVRNGSVLSLIGVMAAALAGGVSIRDVAGGAAAWGFGEGLRATLGERQAHAALAILNVLSSILSVIDHYNSKDSPSVARSVANNGDEPVPGSGGDSPRATVVFEEILVRFVDSARANPLKVAAHVMNIVGYVFTAALIVAAIPAAAPVVVAGLVIGTVATVTALASLNEIGEIFDIDSRPSRPRGAPRVRRRRHRRALCLGGCLGLVGAGAS